MSNRAVVLSGVLASAALGVFMGIWSLQNGFCTDDHFVRALYKGFPELDGIYRTSLETFSFSKGNPVENAWLRDKGVFPWWAVTEAKLHFFRPAASLTHWLDFQVFGDNPMPMHAHNVFWYALLCALLFVLYSDLLKRPWVAAMATLLYAVNETNGTAIGWIASRNTLMVACASAAVLIAHNRWRTSTKDRWAVGAIICYGLGLLCGEGAISVCVYLFAYALFLDTANARTRIVSLVPYFIISVIYLGLHRYYQFGSAGSAWYADPGSDFSGWLRMVAQNAPILFFTELLYWPSVLLVVGPPLVYAYFALMLLLTFAILALLGRTLKNSATARFFLTGAILSLIPVSAVIAQPRVLTISAIGAMALVAEFLAHWMNGKQFFRLVAIVFGLTVVVRIIDGWLRLGFFLYLIVPIALAAIFYWLLNHGERNYACLPQGKLPRIFAGALFCIWIIAHVIIAPNAMYVQTRIHGSSGRKLDAAYATLPSDESIRDKTLIVLQAPNDFTSYYFTLARSGDAKPLPQLTRVLSTGLRPLTIERTGPNTMVMQTTDGFIAQRETSIYRSRQFPMREGESVELSNATVLVTKTDADGWPLEATFTFSEPLDDESFLWYTGTILNERSKTTGRKIRVERYFPVPVPAVGEKISVEELLNRSEKYAMAVAAAEVPEK
ncbi:MAG TPA: hypothetical protein PLJ47_05420 [Candidatus Hydrogenedentes bacterium]|nr:hypothetical protein [Candidatus Hydrogenedentota bacterium]